MLAHLLSGELAVKQLKKGFLAHSKRGFQRNELRDVAVYATNGNYRL